MGQAKLVWFGMKLTPAQKQKIKHLAAREGGSAKEAVLTLDQDFKGYRIHRNEAIQAIMP